MGTSYATGGVLLNTGRPSWVSDPFFVMEHIEFAQCTYRGVASPIDMSVAIAYRGDLQY
jgi:hypothetical protein